METSELIRGLPSCSGQDPKGGGPIPCLRQPLGLVTLRGVGTNEPPLEVLPYLGLESHVTGRRSPSYNAERGDEESRSL